MTLEMLFVLGLIVLAVFLFASEKMTTDITAIVVMSALLLTGILTPQEGVSGFSNSATVTVGAMFVLSAALKETGAVNYLGEITSRIFRINFWFGLIGVMLAVGVISAVVNNTPVVAIFIPVMLGVSLENKVGVARLLMPVSFASMFGGVCTLIGTSTNILVSAIAVQHGLPAFSMFDFTPLGLVFFAVGIAYMALAGVRLIPEKRAAGDLTEKYQMHQYLTDVVLLGDSESVGAAVAESPLVKEMEIDILEVIRDGQRVQTPLAETVLQANDLLRVRCDTRQLEKLVKRMGVRTISACELNEEAFKCANLLLAEVIIAPNSLLVGKTIKSARFKNVFKVMALALRHKGELLNTGFSETPLSAGDAILVETRKEYAADLKNDPNFVIVSEIERPQYRTEKIVPTLLVVAGVISAATLDIVPIMVGAIVGSILLVMTGCISVEDAYGAIEWKVIFLLGGIIALGVALEKTGAARLLSNNLVDLLGLWGPVAVLSALYLLTTLLTSMMSNNATAVLLAPIAIAAAGTLGVSPKPFLMAVAFAASASFMTPVGYQTNTMIYGVGQYRFSDFLKVGTPLNLLFWIIATLLIPVFFPF
jgi:di/tricarboxylate transporter